MSELAHLIKSIDSNLQKETQDNSNCKTNWKCLCALSLGVGNLFFTDHIMLLFWGVGKCGWEIFITRELGEAVAGHAGPTVVPGWPLILLPVVSGLLLHVGHQ